MAAYASRHGRAFVDCALYLPEAWTTDLARMGAAHMRDGTASAGKPALALAMIARVIEQDRVSVRELLIRRGSINGERA